MVLRIGCSKGFTLSLLTLDNWQSTVGEAGRNMPIAFRDGSYGLFFMMLHKKLWQIITAVTDVLNLPKVCLCKKIAFFPPNSKCGVLQSFKGLRNPCNGVKEIEKE